MYIYMISWHERNIFQQAVESQKRGTNGDFYYEYPFIRQSNRVFPPHYRISLRNFNCVIHFVINRVKQSRGCNFSPISSFLRHQKATFYCYISIKRQVLLQIV